MTEQEVREALARAEAATDEEWLAGPDGFVYGYGGRVIAFAYGDNGITNAAFIAAARQDVPALARENLAFREWRAVWEQDSGYHEGVMAERRRVLAILAAEGISAPTAVPKHRRILDTIGPAPEKLPALPPDRTREMLARAVELLRQSVRKGLIPPYGWAARVGEFLKEVES